jgi:hypothetical protein
MRLPSSFVTVLLALASLPLAGCKEGSTYKKIEPAHVDHLEGEAIHKMTLTDKAVERLDVQTTPAREGKVEGAPEGEAARIVVPYSSLIYFADGTTHVYTNPEKNVYIRQPVEVDYIEGDMVVLKKGPAPGTLVASVAAAELLGTEVGVGH